MSHPRILAAALLLATFWSGGHARGAHSQAAPPPRSQQGYISPAVIDDKLEVTGEALRIRQASSRVTLAVTIDDHGPFQFLVDSGADRSVIGAGLAQRLALPSGGAIKLNDMAGESSVATVLIRRLSAGSNEILNIRAPALAEANIGAQGIMGIDALREQRLSMDFERRTITLQDPRRAEPSAGGSDEIVVTARRRRGQLILTEVNIGRIPLSGVIDTGSQVTLGNTALFRKIFARRSAPTVTPIELISVTGQVVTAQMAHVPEVRIGRLVLHNVPIAFSDVAPFRLFGLADEPALLLGSDVLESFRRVSLDFKYRKVRFVLRD